MTNPPEASAPRFTLLASEDWWAIWLGGLLITLTAIGVITGVAGVGRWTGDPTAAFANGLVPLAVLGIGFALLTGVAAHVMGGSLMVHQTGFIPLFLMAVIAYFIANHTGIRAAGVGYAFWALLLGLLISNTVGTPGWLKPALRSELYIKTGLVLLGAEILFNRILNLGPPGLFVAWLVTPIVIFFMYRFGTRVLKIASPSLVIVIAAATSVCGVSAAIAVAAAARAKKDELTLAVGMTLIFTVLMMVLMPILIRAIGMDPIVGAAWIGGTVDATGAVVAAGAMLGEEAGQVAAVVKMIQNILIGIVAFLVAVYWVTNVEKSDSPTESPVMQIWTRFPKFILGFIGASLVFSFVLTPMMGEEAVNGILDLTSDFRGWFFCLAFVSIGLESNMKQLMAQVQGGRPIQLYLVGQTFNVVLTLGAAYLAFGGILFDRVL
jgi:uncharacterized integral membrane protein (TIGR00698 family)